MVNSIHAGYIPIQTQNRTATAVPDCSDVRLYAKHCVLYAKQNHDAYEKVTKTNFGVPLVGDLFLLG